MANVTIMSAAPWVGILIFSLMGGFLLFFSIVLAISKRYKKCPPDKVMVIYGRRKGKNGASASKCINGGAQFIWPIIHSYSFLDLTPISINVDLRAALSHQNIRVDVPSRFMVGISTEPGVMQNAAERLLGLKLSDIQDLANDIILGQLRLVIALMDIEEINTNRDKFLAEVVNNVETELKKIGLKLINVNITDIRDESGYIDALGKEAAAKAINDAKRSVAERNRDGMIGEANALMEQRVSVARAESEAVEGENKTRAKIAQSKAELREVEAEAERRASAAELIAQANAKREAYAAQEQAEKTRAKREQSTLEADVLVKVEIEKRKLELEAEAKAEQARRLARGEADAVVAMRDAEAKGMFEILSKQAEGFSQLVSAAGGADSAIKMMLTDKMEDLVRVQVEAIKNIKIDKVTVWDSMGNGSAKEGSTTAGFISSLYKSVPPLNEIFKMSGMELPSYLGKVSTEGSLKAVEVTESEAEVKRAEAEIKRAEAEIKRAEAVTNEKAVPKTREVQGQKTKK